METTRQPGDGTPSLKPSRGAAAANAVASTLLSPGSLYTARVSARQDDGTYTVSVRDPKVDVNGAQLALPILGGLLGVQVRCSLPPSTGVVIVYGAPSLIVATIPDANKDWENARNRSLIWGEDMGVAQGVTGDNYADHAEDLLEGEVEIGNLHGVAVDLLTTLARVRAGDRAAIECFLINDMVRVISGQYRHISGIGEDLIFDHGRPTLERSWSSYRHEVLGVADGSELAPLNGDEADRETMSSERVSRLGRYRYREFAGFAGDFIHSFVSDPPAALASMAKGSADAGAGKSLFHRNSDGSILLQSAADIRIERCTRIPVAVRFSHHEDPEVTAAREYGGLEAAFLKLPDMVSPADPADAYQAAYHIRSYARWLGRFHSFARMLQLGGEYDIPSEADSPEPDWNNAEADRAAANPAVRYYDAYACMAIHRDGSIVHHDGYGGSFVFSNGNAQLSAVRHVDIEAGGDIRMVAGGSVHIKARRNIELSTRLGGIVLHGYAWLKGLCERGSVWLRSNARTGPGAPAPEPKEEGAPTPEIAGGHEDGWAVLLEASEGASAYRSDRSVTIAADGSPSGEDDDSFDIRVKTRGNVDLYGQRELLLHSRRDVKVGAGRGLALAANSLVSNASEMLVGPNVDAPYLVMRGGSLYARRIESKSLSGNIIMGPRRGPIIPTPDPQPQLPLKTHFNHIDELPEAVEAPDGASEEIAALLRETVADVPKEPETGWSGSSDGPLWGFPDKSEYVWDDREEVPGGVPETLTQQFMRLDVSSDRWGGDGFKDWTLRDTLAGSRTKRVTGFGAYEQQLRASDEGENLHEPSGTAPADMEVPESSWGAAGNLVIKALKRPGE